MGPVGPCSPGIHCGYSRVMGPALAGIVICAWKRRRGASVASTRSFTTFCACNCAHARTASVEIRMFHYNRLVDLEKTMMRNMGEAVHRFKMVSDGVRVAGE